MKQNKTSKTSYQQHKLNEYIYIHIALIKGRKNRNYRGSEIIVCENPKIDTTIMK